MRRIHGRGRLRLERVALAGGPRARALLPAVRHLAVLHLRVQVEDGGGVLLGGGVQRLLGRAVPVLQPELRQHQPLLPLHLPGHLCRSNARHLRRRRPHDCDDDRGISLVMQRAASWREPRVHLGTGSRHVHGGRLPRLRRRAVQLVPLGQQEDRRVLREVSAHELAAARGLPALVEQCVSMSAHREWRDLAPSHVLEHTGIDSRVNIWVSGRPSSR
mmetsp:Transcript_90085/g.250705  ORF Transcript_90085/g.250705 Transcript_90085/m.250705 type:complete len:217 (-) Transcript_90085:65-715(-)